MKNLLLVLGCALILASCTDAKRDKVWGYGKKYTVEVFSGGQLVRTYTSSGKVSSESGTDGYYFNNAVTGKLTEVSGTIVITQVD